LQTLPRSYVTDTSVPEPLGTLPKNV